MCGKILYRKFFKRKHHFSNEKNNKCYWYLVKMETGLKVLMPETCIIDLKEEIERYNREDLQWVWGNDNSKQNEALRIMSYWQQDRLKYLFA